LLLLWGLCPFETAMPQALPSSLRRFKGAPRRGLRPHPQQQQQQLFVTVHESFMTIERYFDIYKKVKVGHSPFHYFDDFYTTICFCSSSNFNFPSNSNGFFIFIY
jgi:hypothetical protein